MPVIAFDLDGTLSDWDAALARALPLALGDEPETTAADVATRLADAVAALHPVGDHGHLVDQCHYLLVADPLPVWRAALPGTADEVLAAWATGLIEVLRPVPFPDVAPALDALRGQRLAALSNSPRLARDLAALGLDHHFDTVISLPPDLRKPRPEGFAHACGLLGITPEQLVYVGDSLRCDVEGASAAGARAVWLDRCGATGCPTPPGAARITTLAHLPTLLASA